MSPVFASQAVELGEQGNVFTTYLPYVSVKGHLDQVTPLHFIASLQPGQTCPEVRFKGANRSCIGV